MQGKVRPFNLLRRALSGIGQGFEETLRNLPARISASNLRNYCVGLKIRYAGTLTNKGSKYTITPREILHALGTISYKDSWGTVYDSMPVDRIYAGNLIDRFWNYCKFPGLCSMDVGGSSLKAELAAGAEASPPVTFLAEVILPYAPAYFSNVRRDGSMFDGVMPCSMLGEEAAVRFGGVGAAVTSDVSVEDVTITVDAVVLQSKELIAPMPIEFRDAVLNQDTNPYIETGDARKYNHLFVMSTEIGTDTTPVMLAGEAGDLSELLVDLDGHVAYQGPAETLVRDNENIGDGSPWGKNGVYDGGLGSAVLGSSFLYGEIYAILDPRAWEKSTQGQAAKRLELRGVGPMEKATTLIMSERRYECPSALFERWADREGISAADRKDLRIGGMATGATKLRRSEAIGVPQVVASRKERKE